MESPSLHPKYSEADQTKHFALEGILNVNLKYRLAHLHALSDKEMSECEIVVGHYGYFQVVSPLSIR